MAVRAGLVLLAGCVLILSAAEPGRDAAKAMDGGAAARRDAAAAFARQAGEAPRPEAGRPAVVGSYVWNGRADRDYRPFFQWELRLLNGGAELREAELRVLTLGLRREILAQGPWQPLGALAAGARRDLAVHLNCGVFPAYQVEVRWAGAAAPARFLATDRQALPRSLDEAAARSWVAVVGADAERNDRQRTAAVTWALWNLGGVAAQGVTLTIRLRGADGAEVKRAAWSPPRGELAAGYGKEHRLVLTQVPDFAGLAIDVQESAAAQPAADGAPAADVEVRDLRLAGGQVSGQVRNGLAQDLRGLRVELVLRDAQGGVARRLPLAVGDLAAGASRAFSLAAPGLAGLAGHDLSWTADQP